MYPNTWRATERGEVREKGSERGEGKGEGKSKGRRETRGQGHGKKGIYESSSDKQTIMLNLIAGREQYVHINC